MDGGAEDGKAGDLSSNTTVLSEDYACWAGIPMEAGPGGLHTSSELSDPA